VNYAVTVSVEVSSVLVGLLWNFSAAAVCFGNCISGCSGGCGEDKNEIFSKILKDNKKLNRKV